MQWRGLRSSGLSRSVWTPYRHFGTPYRVRRCKKKTFLLDFLTLEFETDRLSPTFGKELVLYRPPLWFSGQSFWLQIQRSRVRFPALPDFLSGSGSGTGYTQPREPREVN